MVPTQTCTTSSPINGTAKSYTNAATEWSVSKNLDPIRGQIEILRFVKARKAELKELEDRARAAVEAAMGDDDEGTLDGTVAITWKTFKRRQLDQAALAKAHPNLVEEFKVPKSVRRFEVLDEKGEQE
jgi:predicted phage-related endonuclease